jgi:hypothetical protein
MEYADIDRIKKQSGNVFVELFDWIINIKTLRGSKTGDQGLWMSASEKPAFFCPQSRTIELTDGKKFIIKKINSCKALNIEKENEKILNTLPVKYNTL